MCPGSIVSFGINGQYTSICSNIEKNERNINNRTYTAVAIESLEFNSHLYYLQLTLCNGNRTILLKRRGKKNKTPILKCILFEIIETIYHSRGNVQYFFVFLFSIVFIHHEMRYLCMRGTHKFWCDECNKKMCQRHTAVCI